MEICQIVGYKNTGKTFVTETLIQYYTKKGLSVGSLKHHGHGGDIDLDKTNDSGRHFASGAILSGVQGESIDQLTLNHVTIDQLIAIYKLLAIDLLVMEGYKKLDYPKIVLLKHESELTLLQTLSNIIAVGTWNSSLIQHVTYPTFHIDDIGAFLPSLMDYIKSRRC